MSKKRGRPKKAKPNITHPITHFEIVEVDDTTCAMCFAEFLDPEDLQLHFDQVHGVVKGVIQCGFCYQQYNDAERYVIHIRNEHLLNLCACQFCFRCFVNRNECAAHEKQHITSMTNKYSCSNCKETFSLKKELELHELETHKNSHGVFLHKYYSLLSSVLNIQIESFLKSLSSNTTYVCQKCTYSNLDLNRYLNHLKKSNCRSAACDKCFYVYSTTSAMQRHLARSKTCRHDNNEEDLYKNCPKCSKKVLHTVYSEHKSNCNAVKCQHCGLILQSGIEFAEHFSKNHPKSILVHCCQYCSKYFSGVKALNQHFERIHKPELPLYKYKCNDCNIVFKHPKQLFTHFQRSHPDIKPFTCKICEKSYKLRRTFTIHIKLEHKSMGQVRFTDKSHVIFEHKPSTDEEDSGNDLTGENKDKTELTSRVISEENISEKAKETYNKNKILSNENALAKTKEIENKNEELSDTKNVLEEPKEIDDKNGMLSYETDPENAPSDNEKPIEEKNHKNDSIKKSEEENSKKDSNDKVVKDLSVTGTKDMKTRKRKHKTKQQISIEFLESDSDDEPLLSIARKNKRHKKTKKQSKKGDLTCDICNKKCYTILNYKQHLAMHKRNQSKVCIKCNESFSSVQSLKLHYTRAHSKSALTDTLKRLLNEKKRGLETVKKPNINKLEFMKSMFKNTIKKIEFEKSDAVATITKVKPNDSNKNPNDQYIQINTNITIKKVLSKSMKPPSIKIYKFKPPSPLGPNIKLAMPTKCNIPAPNNEHKATIKMVGIMKNTRPKLNFSNKIEGVAAYETLTLYPDYTDHHDSGIPDVAHEVMLDATDHVEVPKTKFTHKIVIPHVTDSSGYENIRIAHLLPEAPYYKIVTVKDILQIEDKEPEIKKEEKIELPGGTKLVNVNPLAHLLKNKNILEPTPTKPIKRRKEHKKELTKDYQQEVAKALLKLEKTAPTKQVRKKKTKYITPENDSKMEISVSPDIDQSDGLKSDIIGVQNQDIDNLLHSISDVSNTDTNGLSDEQNILVDIQRLTEEEKAVDEDAPTEIEYLEEFEDVDLAEMNTGPGLSLPEL